MTRAVWLVEVHIVGTDQDSWVRLPDWPVTDEQSAARIFTMYRQWWGVEDRFTFLKTRLGWEEVQVLAKLGGWEPHKDRHPGKITLQRGLSRLLDMLVAQAVLSQYETTHHGLPPQIAAFLHNWGPPHQL